jgi:hypothetical protein
MSSMLILLVAMLNLMVVDPRACASDGHDLLWSLTNPSMILLLENDPTDTKASHSDRTVVVSSHNFLCNGRLLSIFKELLIYLQYSSSYRALILIH